MMKKKRSNLLTVLVLALCLSLSSFTGVLPAYAQGENPGETLSNEVVLDNAQEPTSTVPATEGTQDTQLTQTTGQDTAVQEVANEPAANNAEPATPTVAVQEPVAQIGDVTYTTLDEAVNAAKDGETIVVLKDCTTKGMNLSKNLTITGPENGIDGNNTRPLIKFDTDGIALWGKTLSFRKCNIEMIGIGSTPYSEWRWMAISAGANSIINLDEVDMFMDRNGDNNNHAIYFSGNNKFNVTNSKLTIKNYKQDALEWDGGDGGYNCNFKNSTFISDHNRSGFTGNFYVTADNSNIQVINSTGNGSNGSYYDIKNNSFVEFSNNRNWGMSGYYIYLSGNSTINAHDNGYSGIWARAINVDGTSTLDIQRNGNHSLGSKTNAGLLFYGNGKLASKFERGSKVTIKDNAGSGIYTGQGVCNLTIDTDAVITNNGLGKVDTYNHYTAKYGGGVYNVGTMVLSSDVVLYNNHAAVAGDDIYSTNDIEFTIDVMTKDEKGNPVKRWELDGAPDCNNKTHKIDGWYEDNENDTTKDEDGNVIETLKYNRWNAHPVKQEDIRINKLGYGHYDGMTIALKAAHGMVKLTYEFVSGTEGKELPAEVLELLPKDANEYGYGSNVAAIQPASLEVKVPEGTWKFMTYDKAELVDMQDDGKFVGTWVLNLDVSYEFVSGTKGKELPKEVLDLLPTDTNKYPYGSNVKAIQPEKLEVKVADGTWKFVSYDNEELVGIKEHGKFVGTWVFEANKPKPTPTPTPKPTPTPGFDDGGPFTTDECGSVYDRWGNLMWKSPVCEARPQDGYGLVNTLDK